MIKAVAAKNGIKGLMHPSIRVFARMIGIENEGIPYEGDHAGELLPKP